MGCSDVLSSLENPVLPCPESHMKGFSYGSDWTFHKDMRIKSLLQNSEFFSNLGEEPMIYLAPSKPVERFFASFLCFCMEEEGAEHLNWSSSRTKACWRGDTILSTTKTGGRHQSKQNANKSSLQFFTALHPKCFAPHLSNAAALNNPLNYVVFSI